MLLPECLCSKPSIDQWPSQLPSQALTWSKYEFLILFLLLVLSFISAPVRLVSTSHSMVDASCILQGKLKTKLHLQLGALKEEFNPSWEFKPCTTIPVFYSTRGLDWHGRYLSRELSGITTPHFAYGVQLWVNSLIPLTGKQYKMKEYREKSTIPFFLQPS